MDGGIIYNDNGLVWQSSTKAIKEEEEVVCPYPFGLGVVGIEEIVVHKAILGQGNYQGHLLGLGYKPQNHRLTLFKKLVSHLKKNIKNNETRITRG